MSWFEQHRRRVYQGSSFDFLTGLVSAWKLDNNLTDYTGFRNLNALDSETYGAGVVGSSLDTNTNKRFDATNGAGFNMSDNAGTDYEFTLCGWVKTSSTAQANIIGKDYGKDFTFNIFLNNAYLNLYTTNTSNRLQARFNGMCLADGNWQHIAVTYNASKIISGIKGYRNGVEFAVQDSSAGAYTGMTMSYGRLKIAHLLTTTWRFNGFLDELKVYKNRVLTQEEILEMYTIEAAGGSVLP